MARIGAHRAGGIGQTDTLRGFDFTKEPYATWASGLAMTGCTVEDLGASSDNTNHVYGLSCGDAAKPAIMIVGCLHGVHEWRNAYILRQFMTNLVTPPPENREAVRKILDQFRVYCIPCVNVYGYINVASGNANGINLNRNFDYLWAEYDDSGADPLFKKGSAAFSEPESQYIRNKFQALDPVVFLDCHIKGTGTGTLVEALANTGIEFWDTVDAAVTARGIDPEYYEIGGAPRSAHWAAQQVSSKGWYTLANTFEAGATDPNSTQAWQGLNYLMQMCLAAADWIQNSHTYTIKPAASGEPIDDAYISAVQPTYNYGIGSVLRVGRLTNVFRGLIKFDIANKISGVQVIPLGAVVDSAVLALYCESESSAVDYSISLHRALAAWYEGVKDGAVPDAAQDGSTWNLRNANGSLGWGAAGGQSGTDYAASASASATITGTGAFTFDLTSDVQNFVDGSLTNYGWFIIHSDESSANTRKVFTSSDGTAANRPTLTIVWHLP